MAIDEPWLTRNAAQSCAPVDEILAETTLVQPEGTDLLIYDRADAWVQAETVGDSPE